MARSGKRSNSTDTRDPTAFATDPGRALRSPQSLFVPQEVEDLRHNLDTFSPARLLDSLVAPISVEVPKAPRQAPSRVPYQIAFQAPAQTLVCVRRRTRQQVLHAKRKTGKGGQRKSRWRKWSTVRC